MSVARDKLRNPHLQGVIVLDKPKGYTSQEAVSRARASIRTKKMGHGGTLDPFATGVLPLMVNSATRIATLLGSDDKVYEGVMRLGITTDTLDPTGTVTAENPVGGLEPSDIERAARGFVGEIEQIPPMYSAKKIKGKRLYELARENVEVEREPKPVTIHELEIVGVELPQVSFRVRCSSGTYVRVLVSEIGEQLGCGAHLAELVRVRSGRFRLEDAVSLQEIDDAGTRFRDEEAARTSEDAPKRWRWPHAEASSWWQQQLGESLRSVPQATGLETLSLDDRVLRALGNGEPVRAEHLQGRGDVEFASGQSLLASADGHRVIAVLRSTCRSDLVPKMPPRSPVLQVVRVLR